MNTIVNLANQLQSILDKCKQTDFIVLLMIRLYLAPIMIIAGWNKLMHFEDTAWWFGNSLGFPLPELMAALAISAELLGGFALVIGFATRWASIPLLITMLSHVKHQH